MQRGGSDLDLQSEPDKIAREFDEDACDFCNRYKRTGLSRSSRQLLKFILEEGVPGRSVADLGCGAGGFSIELLKKGAENLVGFDLSPKMIESANQLARANGLDSRARFQVANAAIVGIPPSDIVVMDKILCCYSDWKPLLKNAMATSRSGIGFVVPRDEGIAKPCFRLGVRIVNFFQKRRGRILFYLHPLRLVDETLRDSGFIRRKKQGSRLWLVFLYSRPGSDVA